MRFDKPAGYLCLGDQFCWPVYGWRPSKMQQVMWHFWLGVSWKDA